MDELFPKNIELLKIRNTIKLCSDVSIAFLFGSSVTNRLSFDSDIDIAIAGYSALKNDRLNALSLELSELVNRPVDLVDLTVSKGLIFYQALTKGIPILIKDTSLMRQLMQECVYFSEDFLPNITNMLELRARRFAHA